jgi:hypothetical protein
MENIKKYDYIGKNDAIICEKILDILVNFNNKIDMNNYLINEKIRMKINLINYLHINGFSMLNFDNKNLNNIVYRLDKIELQNSITTYNDEVNKLLGKILHNIYEYSGYNVLISNMPEYGIIIGKETFEKIDSNIIYDTMEEFGGECTVNQVFQISTDKYLVKFINDSVADKVCKQINNMIVGKNLIRVEYMPIRKSCNNLENQEQKQYEIRNKFINSIQPNSGVSNNFSLTKHLFNIVSNFVSNILNNIYNGVKYGLLSSKYGK